MKKRLITHTFFPLHLTMTKLHLKASDCPYQLKNAEKAGNAELTKHKKLKNHDKNADTPFTTENNFLIFYREMIAKLLHFHPRYRFLFGRTFV